MLGGRGRSGPPSDFQQAMAAVCSSGGHKTSWAAVDRSLRSSSREEINQFIDEATGDTAVHVAAMYNRVMTLELLLLKGADPEAFNNLGYTALHLAVRAGAKSVAKMLLDNGANPHSKTRLEGHTALDLAQSHNGMEALVTHHRGYRKHQHPGAPGVQVAGRSAAPSTSPSMPNAPPGSVTGAVVQLGTQLMNLWPGNNAQQPATSNSNGGTQTFTQLQPQTVACSLGYPDNCQVQQVQQIQQVQQVQQVQQGFEFIDICIEGGGVGHVQYNSSLWGSLVSMQSALLQSGAGAAFLQLTASAATMDLMSLVQAVGTAVQFIRQCEQCALYSKELAGKLQQRINSMQPLLQLLTACLKRRAAQRCMDQDLLQALVDHLVPLLKTMLDARTLAAKFGQLSESSSWTDKAKLTLKSGKYCTQFENVDKELEIHMSRLGAALTIVNFVAADSTQTDQSLPR